MVRVNYAELYETIDDCTMKKSVGILTNVLVNVAYFIFQTNFVIPNYEVDFDIFSYLGKDLPSHK